jgi:hypothetical protein
VSTSLYEPSLMGFDDLPKKPAALGWNIFCLVFGLLTVAVFGFALSHDLGYHPMAVIAGTQTMRAVEASLTGDNLMQPLQATEPR